MSIAVCDLSFSYAHSRKVLDRISFIINQGRIISILGPNGAGKSTLLACLARLNLPDSGEVFFDGKNYRNLSQQEIARTIGFVPQISSIAFDYSVVDYVVTGCAPRMGAFQKPRAAEYDVAYKAIEAMGIEHLAEKSVMRLSGGERQQVVIARVIAQKPKVILLDEPTAHLDYGNQMKVLRTLKHLSGQGYGVVMTTHSPDHVLLLDDQVAILDPEQGFTFGKTTEVLNEGYLCKLYGTPLRLLDIKELGRRVCVAEGIGGGSVGVN